MLAALRRFCSLAPLLLPVPNIPTMKETFTKPLLKGVGLQSRFTPHVPLDAPSDLALNQPSVDVEQKAFERVFALDCFVDSRTAETDHVMQLGGIQNLGDHT